MVLGCRAVVPLEWLLMDSAFFSNPSAEFQIHQATTVSFLPSCALNLSCESEEPASVLHRHGMSGSM
jgi:hypothetical protein